MTTPDDAKLINHCRRCSAGAWLVSQSRLLVNANGSGWQGQKAIHDAYLTWFHANDGVISPLSLSRLNKCFRGWHVQERRLSHESQFNLIATAQSLMATQRLLAVHASKQAVTIALAEQRNEPLVQLQTQMLALEKRLQSVEQKLSKTTA